MQIEYDDILKSSSYSLSKMNLSIDFLYKSLFLKSHRKLFLKRNRNKLCKLNMMIFLNHRHIHCHR